MEVKEFLRVVALRKGKLKPVEFRLRDGEVGLSVFAHAEVPSPAQVIEAVRAAGKRGELAAATIEAAKIGGLGLKLVQTAGGTADPEVNGVHYEAQLAPWRRLFLWLRGVRIQDYFNENLSDVLCRAARLLTERNKP